MVTTALDQHARKRHHVQTGGLASHHHRSATGGPACRRLRLRCGGSFPARSRRAARAWKPGSAHARAMAAAANRRRSGGIRRRRRGGKTAICSCPETATWASNGARAGSRSKAARQLPDLRCLPPESRACASAGSNGRMLARRSSNRFSDLFANGTAHRRGHGREAAPAASPQLRSRRRRDRGPARRPARARHQHRARGDSRPRTAMPPALVARVRGFSE